MTQLDRAKSDLKQEAKALWLMARGLNERFDAAVALLGGASGRVVVTGMGKNGHIGAKIAATMASTGTPAFFLHPGEALHGDLGMLTPDDALLAMSNSGGNFEVLRVVEFAKGYGIPVVSMSANAASNLAKMSDVALTIPALPEACPLNMAPTTSTTVMLALGDALALALMRNKTFSAADFVRLHPAGALGRK